jgi:pre-mRNA-splicing factor 18
LDGEKSSATPARETESPKPPESSFNIPNEETIRRLRARGQPIRLFGESDKDRRLRLRALELIEEKGHARQGGQNDFKKALEDVENSEREREARNRSTKGKKREESETDSGEDSVLDLELVKTDPDKLYPLIYYALKRRLKDWEAAMEERPGMLLIFSIILASATECATGEVKRTTQGKLAAATQMQSAEYLKPLFKALRSRVRFLWMDYSAVD